MTLRLQNTLSGKLEEFTPLDPERVTMYVCGPTVYNHPHIGNARPAVVFDVLFRLLRFHYPNVVYARNITDVDDKINAAARERGVEISEITEQYTAVYLADMDGLGVLRPTLSPRATDHISEMIAMIERLVDRGHAYAAENHVLFNVASFDGYGMLSKCDLEQMMAGARVEVAPYKRDPSDFVLWKPSSPELPGWPSPWGRGRPGWHLECSAMIETHLGETIDIHGGGIDLVFPHHENEIAQSMCAHQGKTFARFWLHNGFINMDNEKMSKSLGNVLLVSELLKRHPGEAIRCALLSTSYRRPLDWSDETVPQARKFLDRIYGALRELQDISVEPGDPPPEVIEALDDDLNTPLALSHLARWAGDVHRVTASDDRARLKRSILDGGHLLGVAELEPEAWFAAEAGEGELTGEAIEVLIAERADARVNRNFQRADAIREQLADAGVVLEDKQGETRWRRTS
ncbi:MAG: cysteine--tRNA ligase [Myxococcota bacterium]